MANEVIYGLDRTRLAALHAKLTASSDAELLAVARDMTASLPLQRESPRVWSVLCELTRRLEAK